jgi:hypothetical protein
MIDTERWQTIRELPKNVELREKLSHDLNVNRVCALWVLRILTYKNLAKRVQIVTTVIM